MKISSKLQMITLMTILPYVSQAFESGSTGADGALNITEDTELVRPTGGVLNFTSVNIAPGFTLTFTGYNNTPVILLASDDVIIGGTIDISGEDSGSIQPDFSISGAFIADGGPGGFDGGHAGATDDSGPDDSGGNGLGLGSGERGTLGPTSTSFGDFGCGGGGGGFGTAGVAAFSISSSYHCRSQNAGAGGQSYGTANLLPLFGGSGGGGGSGGRDSFGTGGGGGGGALLIASSATVRIDGNILADGGDSGNSNAVCGGSRSQLGGTGGGGSGGGIRIIAESITGSGNISAIGGIAGLVCSSANRGRGGAGGLGRIRLEAEVRLEFSNTSPALSFGGPAPVFATNIPSITITSVAGIAAPGVTTGFNDIILPQNTPNPTTVEFTTNQIPAGGTITLKAMPVTGAAATAESTPIVADGTASVSINLPSGPSILIASTTFTVVASLGADFSKYAQGEQVEKVRVGITAEGQSETTFITIGGKEFTVPSNAVALQ